MHYTYVLQSKSSGRLYVGSTADLRKRFEEHNSGKVRSTKAYRPWRLTYYEAHLDSGKAKVAELFYKTGQGRRQIKKKLGL
ncbi:GIY-YIG nuclease family protein [Patescibacteria group bacterium]|nr:GIY-YIG nuclease family protein [Patescibacteria group bacterium]MBU1907091.1 GIY-YIG nuclease family protein [Patescibacteria group bacterium]